MSIEFATNVMEDTLEAVRQEQGQQWPLALDTEIVDCDWEENICPVCNHDLNRHSRSQLGVCANAAF